MIAKQYWSVRDDTWFLKNSGAAYAGVWLPVCQVALFSKHRASPKSAIFRVVGVHGSSQPLVSPISLQRHDASRATT